MSPARRTKPDPLPVAEAARVRARVAELLGWTAETRTWGGVTRPVYLDGHGMIHLGDFSIDPARYKRLAWMQRAVVTALQEVADERAATASGGSPIERAPRIQ